MEILIYFQIFVAGWISCHFYMAWKLYQALKKIAEENGLTINDITEKITQTTKIKTITFPNYFTETSGSSILLYNKDTGDFVSQAVSLDELAQNLYEFHKVLCALVKHNNQHYWFVEGKVQNDFKEIK